MFDRVKPFKIRLKPVFTYTYYWVDRNGTYGSSSQDRTWPVTARRVWRQGPKGGVKIVHDDGFGRYEYITQQPDEMAEFERARTFALLSR
mgnify:CR=1 FL=1